MQRHYPDNFKDSVNRLLVEGVTSPHAQAIYYEIEAMIKSAEKAIDMNVESWPDEKLRYYNARVKVLKDIMKMPDKAKESIDNLSLDE